MNAKPRCSYQLHVQLCEVKPAVWRRIVVADNITLAQLHRTIQAAMGWHNRHLYAFEIAGQRYGLPDADWPEDPTMDARRYTLGQLLQGQALTVRYLYDFGDGWLHRIKLESIGALSDTPFLPQCIAGRNACPPEDCGGTPGYADFLEAINDSQHHLYAAARQLHPAAFDAKHFDLAAAQARLAQLRIPAQRPSHVKTVATEDMALYA